MDHQIDHPNNAELDRVDAGRTPGCEAFLSGRFVADANEAAELGKPSALAALIDLKLSGHVQFGDKEGGCELAAKSGGKALAAKVAERCAVN
ncbi:MAG: hypothetical protein JWN71_2851 [Xanthobacteraceae bacterium]|nr:hypothetical protein [Xanthobacteraceae bacterium]